MADNASETEDVFEIPEGMTVCYLRLIKRAPGWTPGESPELERLQAAHLAYNRKLVEAGKLFLNGPMLDDDGSLRGASIMNVGSLEEAQTLADGDPSVQAGRLMCEVHPWMIQKGVLPE
jgi:uncharacterized protein YciI